MLLCLSNHLVGWTRSVRATRHPTPPMTRVSALNGWKQHPDVGEILIEPADIEAKVQDIGR
jgi:hypothetical protein